MLVLLVYWLLDCCCYPPVVDPLLSNIPSHNIPILSSIHKGVFLSLSGESGVASMRNKVRKINRHRAHTMETVGVSKAVVKLRSSPLLGRPKRHHRDKQLGRQGSSGSGGPTPVIEKLDNQY